MQEPATTRTAGRKAGPSLPLSTLLSQVLVAYTIEFDNEFEHRTPHRTTVGRSEKSVGTWMASGPWLASMVMWSNLMQYVDEDGVTVGELQRRARTERLLLHGMQRWGYIKVMAGEGRAPKVGQPKMDWLVLPTLKGRMAQAVWGSLFDVIEKRWEERFGVELVASLRELLSALVRQIGMDLPDYLPVLAYGLFGDLTAGQGKLTNDETKVSRLALSALLSKVLLAFTLEFERGSELSLAIAANVVRVLGYEGLRVRDLPLLTGVSKEAIQVALGFLEKRGYAVVETDSPAGRTKMVRLTAKGLEAQEAYLQRLMAIEAGWKTRFGKDAICKLRTLLEQLVGAGGKTSPLRSGLEPHPEGWRAAIPTPETLPHYPMVLHRGGFPDGS